MTWPSSASKTHLDQATDDPKQARGELATFVDKFNEMRSHVPSFMQTFLSRTTAAAARSDLGVGKISHPRKTSDQTVNNSTTLVNDSELKYALAANEEVKFQLLVHVNGNNTANFRASFSLPSGATMRWSAGQPGSGDGVARAALTSGSNLNLTLHPDNDSFIILSGFVDNGSTTGDLQFRWAQSTADASDTKVKTGSTLTVWTL